MKALPYSSIQKASKFLKSNCHQNKKNSVLKYLIYLLQKNSKKIISENQKDFKALDSNANSAFKDRLLITENRINAMILSLENIISLKDPVGEIVENKYLKNKLLIKKVRSPIGVILLIYESRPNVAIEAFALGFKSGNAMILRGGKETRHTVSILYKYIEKALVLNQFPKECCIGLTNPNRDLLKNILKEKQHIDLVIPRGGEKLIEFVQLNTEIPIIKNDRGMCHIYVHEDANIEMATSIIENSKTQRPGVCNAMETLVVHDKIAKAFLPECFKRIPQVIWHVDKLALKYLPKNKNIKQANLKSYDTEYLSLEMNCKIVHSLEEAIKFIELHSSKHSEAIITKSKLAAKKFQTEIDSAAVYWNTSTRFTDGFELGLGGEIGISTQKLHVRGPVGLKELTTLRWIIDGKGQIRK